MMVSSTRTPDSKFTVIKSDFKVGDKTHAMPFIETADGGTTVNIGYIVKVKGTGTSTSVKETKVPVESIPVSEIGTEGVKIDGNIHVGDFFISTIDPKTKRPAINNERKPVIDSSKSSLQINGIPGRPNLFVLNGDLGGTKLTITGGDGDDTIVAASKSKGVLTNVNFGAGNDRLVLEAGSNIDVQYAPGDATNKSEAETTSTKPYAYIK